MSIKAYFIGGSLDLTKRIMEQRLPEMHFPKCAPLTFPQHYVPDATTVVVESYRCIGRSAVDMDTFIYEYDPKGQR